MPEKLTRIEREIRDHPERFDFADVPPDRILFPEQEAVYEEAAKAHRKKVFEFIGATLKATR